MAQQIAAAAGRYIVSIEYKDSRFRGDNHTFYGSASCADAPPFWVSSMPSGYNNSIGSSEAYSSCGARHYDAGGATGTNIPAGASYVCTGDCPQLGAMNDATSSMRWT